ncbi:hypothetical protein [Mycobacteroides abscessus]|uniref:Uncharacterized protein n=3 Tax=Mycobacteroides abscessus TaxID=36809 RepID=A0AB38CUC8_9MYCO|nr:hypothetical protein [Mycobacteroides abscessus]AKP59760.1 hypothetical protein MAUC22_20975 [Mycobacteroides abscessus UC22]AMU22603.1 hypothetical protein A3N95_18600 [Mycobacteroides abscessus]AMU67210.1 hypothetical protein A3O04_19440 [Mycobacteroides abscessus]ANO15747.1 hypothetical protein BAB77_19240 [Mycobacteroides abscessus]ARQ66057.1 hypothetical protein CAK77_19510 [Mycobacteroides abscessus subsp. massiliense]
MTIQTPAGTAGPDIDLILLVEAGPARDLREHPSGRNSATPIAQAVASAGHRIVPLYTNPDRVPPELRSIFVVTAPASPEFSDFAERLRTLPGVTSAYLDSAA